MSKEPIFKLLEKRYDSTGIDPEGWVLIDIVPGDPIRSYYTDEQWAAIPEWEKNLFEDSEKYERGEIYGWARREHIDAKLEATGYTKVIPFSEYLGDESLVRVVVGTIIPMEWKRLPVPEIAQRLWVCLRG